MKVRGCRVDLWKKAEKEAGKMALKNLRQVMFWGLISTIANYKFADSVFHYGFNHGFKDVCSQFAK